MSYGKVSVEDIKTAVAEMVGFGFIESWQGDTRLTRESNGVITEWHVTHEHINGKRSRVEIVQ